MLRGFCNVRTDIVYIQSCRRKGFEYLRILHTSVHPIGNHAQIAHGVHHKL